MAYEKFRENLKNLIHSKGQTISYFANEIGVTPATISRYLSSDRDPDIKCIIRIAEYFRVSIDWLLGVTDTRIDTLPESLKKIADLYYISSPDDKMVIKAILRKYEDSNT